ncbi:hypothetical protein EMIT079MI2_220085 [Bacillus sp. IT-79MI2]
MGHRFQWWGYNDFYIHVIPDNFVDDISVEGVRQRLLLF